MGSLFYSLKYGDFDKEFENFDLDQYKFVYWIKKKVHKEYSPRNWCTKEPFGY